ncbi:ECF-type sigma factor [Verrucomicrobia bacterium]|nr:ECF-type sigma factor [Verrucomicrobiota bacterium]
MRFRSVSSEGAWAPFSPGYSSCDIDGSDNHPAGLRIGDPTAAEAMLPLVFTELRSLAAAKMAREQPGQTLQPTALVHKAWLKLIGIENPEWDSKDHLSQGHWRANQTNP